MSSTIFLSLSLGGMIAFAAELGVLSLILFRNRRSVLPGNTAARRCLPRLDRVAGLVAPCWPCRETRASP